MTKIDPSSRSDKLIRTALGAICMVLSLSLQAYPGGGGHSPGSGERMAEKLSLDENQQALLQAALSSADRPAKHAGGRKLRELIRTENYDAAAVEKIAREMSDAMYERIIERSRRMHTFYSSLSPEQREQMEALDAERRGKRRQRRQQQAH